MHVRRTLVQAPFFGLAGGVLVVLLCSLRYRPLECETRPDNSRVTGYSHGWPLETFTRTSYHDWDPAYSRWVSAGKDLRPNRRNVLILFGVGLLLGVNVYAVYAVLPRLFQRGGGRRGRARHTAGSRRCTVWRGILDGECRETAKSRDELWRRIEANPWYNAAERDRWVITQRNETLPVVLGRAHSYRGRGGQQGIHVHWACPFCGREHVTDRLDPPPAVWPCEGRQEIALVQWKDVAAADAPLEVS